MDAHELVGVRPDATMGEIELAAQQRLGELRAQAHAAPNDSVRAEVVDQMRDVQRACAQMEADSTDIDPRGLVERRHPPFSVGGALVVAAALAVLVALVALYLYASAPGLFCYEGRC